MNLTLNLSKYNSSAKLGQCLQVVRVRQVLNVSLVVVGGTLPSVLVLFFICRCAHALSVRAGRNLKSAVFYLLCRRVARTSGKMLDDKVVAL